VSVIDLNAPPTTQENLQNRHSKDEKRQAMIGDSDTRLRRKALRALIGTPDQPHMDMKPGELLKQDSDYPQTFIRDYNNFQQQYEQRREEAPAFWDYGLQWWGQVKRMLDEHQEENEDRSRSRAIELIRPKEPTP
jgi:hypothetical protein